MDRIPPADRLAESFLLVVIICQDIMCGLLLNAKTGLSRSLSRYMLVMGITFTGALLIPVWPQVFTSRMWFVGIRIAIILSASIALHHLIRSFGGPRQAACVVWDRWDRWCCEGRPWLTKDAPSVLAIGIAAILVLLWLMTVIR